MIEGLQCIGEPTFEEMKKTFGNKVPVCHMPHRNVDVFSAYDEKGDAATEVEPINPNKPMNLQGLENNRFGITDASITKHSFTISI